MIVTDTASADKLVVEAATVKLSSSSSIMSSVTVNVAVTAVTPTPADAVNVAGTVKSVPFVAVPSEDAVNVTVVAVLTGLLNVAVTATSPAFSKTVMLANDTVNDDGAGRFTVTPTSATPKLDPYLLSLLVVPWVTDVVPTATPDTTNVWTVPQLPVVNVRVDGATEAVAAVAAVAVTVTAAVGCVSSFTV